MKKLMILLAVSIAHAIHADIMPFEVYTLMKTFGTKPATDDAVVAIALAANYFRSYESIDLPPIHPEEKASIKEKLLAIINPQIARCKPSQTKITDDLIDAITKRNIAGIQEALNSGADINGQHSDPKNRYTPLTAAIRFNTPNNDILLTLLAVPGVNPNAPDKIGWTPLMYAVLVKRPDIVDALLSTPYCANTTVVNMDGETALAIAEAARKTTPSASLDVIIEKLKAPPCGNK